jgi:lipoprotein-anchoring transpeptidase ErfK/SrfK
MGIKGIMGGLAAAALLVAAVEARAADAAQNGVPTVTIINKSPDAAESSGPPMLTVTPEVPGRPADAGAPGRPQAPSTPGVPVSPGSPSQVASPAAPAAPGAPPAAATAATPADTGTSAPSEAVAAEPPPEPTLGIDIDLTKQVMRVSENGFVLHTWPISSARYGYRTPTGTYQPTWMSKMWYSRQYDYAPMPHAIFFHQGVAIHATYATRQLGMPASHGCVRLAPKNAATLYRMVTNHGKDKTQIVVHGTPDHSSGRIAGAESYQGSTMRVRRVPRYLPPSYYGRGNAAYGPAGAYYAPRKGRKYAQPRYQPRGLYNSYSYGYGF